MNEFRSFRKIARFNRDVIVTEKIDGTNAQINIFDCLKQEENKIADPPVGDHWLDMGDGIYIAAGSRTRFITPNDDNFGFAKWVWNNASKLIYLGNGTHFGEWWGSGIQRKYGLTNGERRFSLFNVNRWTCTGNDELDGNFDDADSTKCLEVPVCFVVPVLGIGNITSNIVDSCLGYLINRGSAAAAGFLNPEGVVIFHAASNTLFKQTLENDDQHKSVI